MGLDGVLTETVGVERRAGAIHHALHCAVLLQLVDSGLLLLVVQRLVFHEDLLEDQRRFLLGAVLPVFGLALHGLVGLHDGEQFLDGGGLVGILRLSVGGLGHHHRRDKSSQNSNTSIGFEHYDSLENMSD
ncbi:hypothetical protein D3C86_1413350 [compost metagenome]